MYRRFGKRVVDFLFALAGLLVLSPILLGLGLAVRWKLGRPVFFRQRRAGHRGRAFYILKFRTMTDARDAEGRPLPDGERLTPLGRWLRRWSLDELPEFVNVLRGDMSLVGPRPLLAEYVGRYSDDQARRHDVRPGVTGWAQVNGRNDVTWEERLAMDVWYVDNVSWKLDIRILWRTLRFVVQGRGVAADDHVTMPEFLGSRSTRSGG